jgi:hypothetical protein
VITTIRLNASSGTWGQREEESGIVAAPRVRWHGCSHAHHRCDGHSDQSGFRLVNHDHECDHYNVDNDHHVAANNGTDNNPNYADDNTGPERHRVLDDHRGESTSRNDVMED